MSTDQHDLNEIEARRQEAIAEMSAIDGSACLDAYRPGTFGCHELMDRVHLICSMFQQHVLEHPACTQNSEWYRLADAAVEAMEALYQEVGASHLDDDSDDEV